MHDTQKDVTMRLTQLRWRLCSNGFRRTIWACLLPVRLTVRHVTTTCTSCVTENVKHGLQSRGTGPYQSLSGQMCAVGAHQPGHRWQRGGAHGSDEKPAVSYTEDPCTREFTCFLLLSRFSYVFGFRLFD